MIRPTFAVTCVFAFILHLGVVGPSANAQASGADSADAMPQLDRSVLPIIEPPRPTFTELDVRQAKQPVHQEIRAPQGAPNVVNGTPQIPMQGTSLVYSFDDANAPERHLTQYFEIAGNRAIYHDGWLARTIHRAAWEPKPRRPLEQDVWELYDARSDFSLSTDLAAERQEKLKQLQALFLQEAAKNHVLPIDDRGFERGIAEMVGRPDLFAGRSSISLAEGMTGMMENSFINVKNKSLTITADVGIDLGTLVVEAIGAERKSRFTGRIPRVVVEVK